VLVQMGWAKTYSEMGYSDPIRISLSIGFIWIHFFQILAGYVSIAYAICILTGYTSRAYPWAEPRICAAQ
jgi:hypothetical protein